LIKHVLRRRFALDHNFPQPVLAALTDALPMAELVPVRDIDPTFADLADWELLRELHRHAGGWDGLITNDDAMLSLAKEMTVLDQTGLSLVVARGEGHNPIRAVGVLLCHLGHICHHTKPGTGQIWRLRVAQKSAEPVRDYLEIIANKAKTTVTKLFADNKLAAADLRRR
jgi:hypothetical protein